MGKIRTFDTGATRDSDEGKNDYEGFLHPLVIKCFGDYMTKHRKQSDGSLRDSDNWQKGIPITQLMKSLWRHFLDLWTIHRGYKALDPRDQYEVTVEDACCGIIFNVQGYLLHHLNKVLFNKLVDNAVLSSQPKCKCDKSEKKDVDEPLKYRCEAAERCRIDKLCVHKVPHVPPYPCYSRSTYCTTVKDHVKCLPIKRKHRCTFADKCNQDCLHKDPHDVTEFCSGHYCPFLFRSFHCPPVQESV